MITKNKPVDGIIVMEEVSTIVFDVFIFSQVLSSFVYRVNAIAKSFGDYIDERLMQKS